MDAPARARIYAARKHLVADIRKYSRAQKKDWQSIPWLALQADGRIGFSDAYARCYRRGIWTLSMPHEHGYHGTFVDCATGEIVGSDLKQASDYAVLFLASSIDQLTTAMIIRDLQNYASDRIPPGSSQQEFDEHALWRERVIKDLSLCRSFVRHKAMAA